MAGKAILLAILNTFKVYLSRHGLGASVKEHDNVCDLTKQMYTISHLSVTNITYYFAFICNASVKLTEFKVLPHISFHVGRR